MDLSVIKIETGLCSQYAFSGKIQARVPFMRNRY